MKSRGERISLYLRRGTLVYLRTRTAVYAARTRGVNTEADLRADAWAELAVPIEKRLSKGDNACHVLYDLCLKLRVHKSPARTPYDQRDPAHYARTEVLDDLIQTVKPLAKELVLS